jgi:hypothetical protein
VSFRKTLGDALTSCNLSNLMQKRTLSTLPVACAYLATLDEVEEARILEDGSTHVSLRLVRSLSEFFFKYISEKYSYLYPGCLN